MLKFYTLLKRMGAFCSFLENLPFCDQFFHKTLEQLRDVKIGNHTEI